MKDTTDIVEIDMAVVRQSDNYDNDGSNMEDYNTKHYLW